MKQGINKKTAKMLEIDGSEGEGGGQVLRTSVAFSALTGKPVRVYNIRSGRNDPGIKAQHLCAVSAVAEVSGAEVEGLQIGSQEIKFFPGVIRSGKISVDVGTAGSVSLVLQALMIPAMLAPETVTMRVRGGTDVKWSPPADYLIHVMIPMLEKIGYKNDVELLDRGYYPAGGGRIDLVSHPVKELRPLYIADPGRLVSVKGISHAHSGLERSRVAERCARGARKILYDGLANTGYAGDIEIRTEYEDAASYGSGITLYAETENTILGADALGEKGKRAEEVGREAGLNLLDEIASKAAVDRYMADQLIPYLAIAGGSVRTAGKLSMHALTNVGIVNRFGCDVKVSGDRIDAGKLFLEKR